MTLEDYIKERYSPKSTNSYLSRIERYKKYNYEHESGTLDQVLAYIKVLRGKAKKANTLKNHLHSIKIYYDYLKQIGKRQDHPCKKLQLKDKVDKRIKLDQLHGREELEAYLDHTPDHKKAIVGLLIHQGLTTSELSEMKAGQIDIRRAEVESKGRTLPLSAVQIPPLIEQLKGKENDDLLFTTRTDRKFSPSQINAHINAGRAPKDRITPLKIRQSVIKHLLEHHDLRLVQVFVGHLNSSSTQRYHSSGLEELAIALEQLHPIARNT